MAGLITLVLLIWKWMGLFLRKNYLLRCWGWLFLLNWTRALALSLLLLLPPKKIGALIRYMKLVSTEVALYLYESTIQPWTEHCCHVWDGGDGASSCYLELLEKQRKWICRTVSPSLAVSLEPLAHRRNRYYFAISILVDVHLNWLNWFHFLILEGGLFVVLIDCMILLSLFLDVTRMSMSRVSFLAQLDSEILCP